MASIFDQTRQLLKNLKSKASTVATSYVNNVAKPLAVGVPQVRQLNNTLLERVTRPAAMVTDQYVRNQVVAPIRQGVQQIRQPGIGNKAMGGLGILQGAFSASPVGPAFNALTATQTAGAKTLQGKGNFTSNLRSSFVNPTNFAQEGLGIQSPILGFGVNLLAGNPKAALLGVKPSTLKALVNPRKLMHGADIDELDQAVDILKSKPKTYRKNGRTYTFSDTVVDPQAKQRAIQVIDSLAEIHLDKKTIDKLKGDSIKLAAKLQKIATRSEEGLMQGKTPYAQGFAQQKGAQAGLYDVNQRAIKKFGTVNPEDAGNVKGFVTPDGDVFNVGGKSALGDHSEVAPLIGKRQGGLKKNEDIKNAFMQESGAARIYRNADEVGIEFGQPLSQKQLESVKKTLLPDGGDFYWDGPNKTGGQFHYYDIDDGIRQIQEQIPVQKSVAQQPLYHGTYTGNKFNVFDETKFNSQRHNAANQGNVFYTTNSKDAAKYFSMKANEKKSLIDYMQNPSSSFQSNRTPGEVLEFKLKPEAKIAQLDHYPTPQQIEQLKKQGYDGASFTEEGFKGVDDWSSEFGSKVPLDSKTTAVWNKNVLNNSSVAQQPSTKAGLYAQKTLGTPSVSGKKYVADYVMPNGEIRQTKSFDTPGMAASSVEKGAKKYQVKSVAQQPLGDIAKQIEAENIYLESNRGKNIDGMTVPKDYTAYRRTITGDMVDINRLKTDSTYFRQAYESTFARGYGTDEKLYKTLTKTLVPNDKEASGYLANLYNQAKSNIPQQPLSVTPPVSAGVTTQSIQRVKELTSELDQAVQAVKTKGQSSGISIADMPKAQEEIISSVKNITPQTKVNLLDYMRTPDRVLTKIGLGNEAVLLKKQYRNYLKELPVEINKITTWFKQAPSPQSSQNIFRYLDGKQIELSPQEMKVANEIQGYLKDWAVKLKLPADRQVTHYITHLFDEDLIKKEFDPDLAKLIQDKVPGSVYDPFLEKRLGALGYKEDVWQALDAYTKRAVRKYNMDPALEALKKGSAKLDVESEKYVARLGARINLRPTEVDNLLDNLIKSAVGYKLGGRPVANLSRKVRQVVYRGTLGLNIGSATRNLTQGANTYAKLGEKYTLKGYIGMFNDLLRRGDELKRVGVLSDNIVQDRSINATKKFWENFDKGLFAMFDFAERVNRGSAYFGAKSKALAKGASEEEAIQAGIKMVEDTQFTFGSVDTPLALQSDLTKIATQFQSFNVKQTELLSEMVKKKELGGLVRYVGANLVMMATVGKLFGMELKDIIPFSGVLTGETKLGQTPPIQAASALGNIAFGDEEKRQQGISDFKKVLPAFIPGGVQAKKTIEGIGAFNEGMSTTPTGRKRFDVPQTGANRVKTALYGQYSTAEAKDYFNNLGKSKSEIIYNEFKGLKTSEEKAALWDRMVKDGRITKDNISDIKKHITDEKLGITKQEKSIRSLPVQDGSRARMVKKQFDSAKTPEEKAALWEKYVESGIITKEVAKQLKTLLQQ